MGDKKKRGESGKKNAESIPFRYGGHNAHQPQNGAHTVQARKWNRETGMGLFGGFIVAKLGFKMPEMSIRIQNWFEKDIQRECPVVSAAIDAA